MTTTTYNARETARSLGLVVKGGKMLCPDPAHDDRHPSCAIGARAWSCMACGAKGDAITLVRLVRDCSYADALEYLGDPIQMVPRAAAKSPAVDPRGDALIARLTRPRPVSVGLRRWLLSRGLTETAALRLGLTDVCGVAQQIRAVLAADMDLAIAAGVAVEDDETGERKPWWVLGRDGRRPMPGVIVPTYTATGPVGVRWRLYAPLDTRHGGTIKTASCYGPRALAGLMRAPGTSRVVVICEGEPDTIAAAHTYPDHTILGHCAIAAGWRAEWTPMLDGAREVIDHTHLAPPRPPTGRKERPPLDAQIRAACERVGARYVDARVPEDDDLADRAKRGSA